MNHLTRIPQICSVGEAANVLRLSFGSAEEVAEFRRLACENAGDQNCAAFWGRVKEHITKLDAEEAANTMACKTRSRASL